MTYDLVFMDAHTHPNDNFRRFDWLGQMILEDKPRSVISLGDFYSLDSMSTYDTRPATSLHEDIQAGIEAQRRMFQPISEWNQRRQASKHGPHRMLKVKIKGNHEERSDRAKKRDPMGFSSVVDFNELAGYNVFWDEVYEYGEIVRINGVDYTHCVLGIMGRALSLTSVSKQTSHHLIQGHQHSLQTVTVPVPGGVRFIMSGPAFMEDQYVPGYAEGKHRGWSYGLLKVRPEGPTEAPSVEYISMKELERRYG